MEARAQLRYYRSSPRKVRLLADMVRGKAVEPALTSLKLSDKYAAHDVEKVFIRSITVDDGPRLRRGRPASKWVRMHRILKRMCHITVELAVRES
jgi:large subunit ribosomal protein L22